MRKLLHVAIAGLAAVSFSALAADGDKTTTDVDANTKIQGDTKAGAGASADIKTDKVDKKKAKKEKRGAAGAGGSGMKSSEGTKAGTSASGSTSGTTETPAAAPAPAPAPASAETQKKTD